MIRNSLVVVISIWHSRVGHYVCFDVAFNCIVFLSIKRLGNMSCDPLLLSKRVGQDYPDGVATKSLMIRIESPINKYFKQVLVYLLHQS